MSENDGLDPIFAALRSQPLPADLGERVRARLLTPAAARPRARRVLVTAALLLVLCGIGAAAVVHWWIVRIDTRNRSVEGGKLLHYYQDQFGNPWAEIELPDGRRVQVQLPLEKQGERRVEVELPDERAQDKR